MTRARSGGRPVPDVDLGLLDGFRFECRPGCGLCCFANPAVTAVERVRLVQLRPTLEFLDGEPGYSFLGNRPDGGACDLLHATRCAAHPARPFPCRSFPISVHLGLRAQASLVLSCPGLSLDGLDRFGTTGGGEAPIGLDTELAAVHAELSRPDIGAVARGAAEELERGMERQRTRPGWIEPEEFRAALRHRDVPWELAVYPEDPPSLDEGPDSIPVTFIPDLGIVGLSGEGEQWTVRRMPEHGGGVELGTYDLPPDPPRLDRPAARLLGGYLRYAFERDAPFGQLLLALRRTQEPWEDELWALVDDVASSVVTRAAVLAQVRGEPTSTLARDAVLAGIRAADADVLDRPTLGAVL